LYFVLAAGKLTRSYDNSLYYTCTIDSWRPY